MNKKTDCAQTSAVKAVLEKVAESIAPTKSEVADLVLSDDESVRKAELQKFFEDLHNLLWSVSGLTPEKALDHMMFFFAYRLFESQADELKLPNECRWSYLMNNFKNSATDLDQQVRKGNSWFLKDARTKLFFKQHEIKRAEIVQQVMILINRIPMSVLTNGDTLGDIFEYMLGRGMSTMSDEGQYFTNRNICSLAFDLAYSIKKTVHRPDGSVSTFADWFAGTGGFPAEFVKGATQAAIEEGNPIVWKTASSSIYCQDMSTSSVTTTLLNMLILTGVAFPSKNIRRGDSFRDPITMGDLAPHNGVSIDYCFMNPPYGGDKTKGKDYKFMYSKKVKNATTGKMTTQYQVNSEIQSVGVEDNDKVSAGLQLAMATLSSDGGVCCIVLPQGFFFGASKKCVELRKKIAEEYRIHCVVDIASGAFANTGTKTSMLVFQKGVGATEKVAFIGLDEKPLVEATLEELRKKNYSLNFKQYLPQTAVEVEGSQMVKLGDIAEIHFGERITKKDNLGTLFPVYGGGNDTFRTDKKNREGVTCKVSRFGISEHNCVQIINGEYWLMDSGFTINAKADKAISSYLWNWLLQNKKAVYNCGRATAQMNMDMETFKSLALPLPSLERQQQIVDAIDGWTNLAHQEEVALGILEKQLMFQVKEMGRGQPRVKLGEIAAFTFGYGIKSEDFGDCGLPIIKTKNFKDNSVSIISTNPRSNKKYDDKYLIKKGDLLMVVDGACGESAIWREDEDGWLNQHVAKLTIDNETTRLYVAFVMKGDMFKEYIQSKIVITTIPHMQRGVAKDFELPLPPLTEQQTLQSDFDEIRHKHQKIATYKTKAQDAIKRLIPSAE